VKKATVRNFALGVLLLAAAVVGGARYINHASRGHPSAYLPSDPGLRVDWLYFYPSRVGGGARAILFLLGNDVAFWEPHQDLAWRLSGEGYTVVGIDVRQLLETLPSDEPQRDSAFGSAMPALISRVRHELRADTMPLILGGHSFGAELSFWIAWHHPPPRLIGLLSLNSRGSGHLFITPNDWLNKEASGAWSFSTVEAAAKIDPHVRIALVRGANDPFRGHDPEFVAAGGARLQRFEIPLAGHGLKTMLVAGPFISRAMHFLTDSIAPPDAGPR
jgi:pimeloyl-ACP methyl ester carboxylesterase